VKEPVSVAVSATREVLAGPETPAVPEPVADLATLVVAREASVADLATRVSVRAVLARSASAALSVTSAAWAARRTRVLAAALVSAARRPVRVSAPLSPRLVEVRVLSAAAAAVSAA
jgi:hypothetical protein